jgi:hypothetical protein
MLMSGAGLHPCGHGYAFTLEMRQLYSYLSSLRHVSKYRCIQGESKRRHEESCSSRCSFVSQMSHDGGV